MADDDDPTGSTIVRHGREAFLLAEMGRFSRELQQRPLEKLVEDLPGLLDLPEAKYALVVLSLNKRMRASDEERGAIEARLRGLAETAPSLVKRRCEALLDPPA